MPKLVFHHNLNRTGLTLPGNVRKGLSFGPTFLLRAKFMIKSAAKTVRESLMQSMMIDLTDHATIADRTGP